MELTAQQQYVVERAMAHKNLQILALAGCAKTTTSLKVAQALYQTYGKKTLILSYNTALKTDTAKRVTKLKMSSYCTVKTIHSALGCYANPPRTLNTDLLLKSVVDAQVPLTPVDFDVIVIDEAQDLTPLLYSAVCMLLEAAVSANQRIQVIILGDIFQRIYGFRNARCEYLMYPERYFLNLEFEQCRLSMNFRCSKKILDWVNNQFNPIRLADVPHYREWFLQNQNIILSAWGSGLEACPEAVRDAELYPDVKEVFVNFFNGELQQSVRAEMKEHYEQEHKSSDIYFIATSIKSGALKSLGATLGRYSNFYFSEAEQRGNTKLEKNKCVMSTICNMKGREADHVKVFPPGSYFENRDLNQQKSLNASSDSLVYDPSNNFNSAYTACTRARKSMTVYWTEAKPSYLQGGQDILLNNLPPSNFSVHDLCAFASDCYEPMQLQNICIVESLSLPGDSTPYFHDAQSRIFPGRCLNDHPTEENYAPTLGCAIEYGIAHTLGTFLPSVANKMQDIQNRIMIWFGCNCVSCVDAPCGLNRHKFEEFSEFLAPGTELAQFLNPDANVVQPSPESITWDHFLQLAVYESSYKAPQLCRQLVGTQSIDRNELSICRDRGTQLIREIQTSAALMSESKLEAVDQILYQEALSKSTTLGFVNGQADFLVGPTQIVVECKVTQEITSEHMTQALLYSAMTPNFGQPCYVIAPNLNQAVRVTPLPGVTASYLLEHAIRRKLGC
jgi:hypothetical protein